MGLEMAVFVGRPVPTPPHLDSKKGGFWVILGSRRLSQTPVLEPRTWVWKWRFALENLFHPPFIWALKMGLNRDFGLWVQAPFPDPVLEPRVGLEMSVFVRKLVPTPPPWSGLQKWGGGGGIVVWGYFGFQAPFPDPLVENLGLEMAAFVEKPVPTPHLGSKNGGWESWFWVVLGPRRLSQTPVLESKPGSGAAFVGKCWKTCSNTPPIWALKMRLGIGVSGTFSRPPFSSREPGSGNSVGNRGFGLIWVRKHPYQTPHSRFGGWGSGFGV